MRILDQRPRGVRFGELLASEAPATFLAMMHREEKLLTIFDPPRRTSGTVSRLICMYLRKALLRPMTWVLLLVYAATALGCSVESHDYAVAGDAHSGDRGICSGPVEWEYADYFPFILNTMAIFLMAFYGNHVYTRWLQMYDTSAETRSSISSLLALCTGTLVKDGGEEALMELWRTANMVHYSHCCLATSAPTRFPSPCWLNAGAHHGVPGDGPPLRAVLRPAAAQCGRLRQAAGGGVRPRGLWHAHPR